MSQSINSCIHNASLLLDVLFTVRCSNQPKHPHTIFPQKALHIANDALSQKSNWTSSSPRRPQNQIICKENNYYEIYLFFILYFWRLARPTGSWQTWHAFSQSGQDLSCEARHCGDVRNPSWKGIQFKTALLHWKLIDCGGTVQSTVPNYISGRLCAIVFSFTVFGEGGKGGLPDRANARRN